MTTSHSHAPTRHASKAGRLAPLVAALALALSGCGPDPQDEPLEMAVEDAGTDAEPPRLPVPRDGDISSEARDLWAQHRPGPRGSVSQHAAQPRSKGRSTATDTPPVNRADTVHTTSNSWR